MDLTEKKLRSSYNRSQNNAIRNVAIKYDQAYPFGSASYKVQLYPSDLDVREKVKYINSTKTKIAKDFAKKLQNIVAKIIVDKYIFYSEIKTGIDDVYKIDIGYIKDKQIYNMDVKRISHIVASMFYEGLFDNDEFYRIMQILKKGNNITIDDWDDLYNILREHYIIRWKAPEILQGYKDLPGGRTITLEEALTHKTMVKIDTWQKINDRYIEVTNFFIITKNNDGYEELINLPDDFYTRSDKSLLEEVDKMICSSNNFKPLKAVKRMWTIAMINKDIFMLKKLTPLINSGVGILNQIAADMETIMGMIQNYKILPLNDILNMISNFKSRLANVINIPLDYEKINIFIDDTIDTNDPEIIYKRLKFLREKIKNIINIYTMDYLIKEKLYPIPDNYLPEEKKYCNDFDNNEPVMKLHVYDKLPKSHPFYTEQDDKYLQIKKDKRKYKSTSKQCSKNY